MIIILTTTTDASTTMAMTNTIILLLNITIWKFSNATANSEYSNQTHNLDILLSLNPQQFHPQVLFSLSSEYLWNSSTCFNPLHLHIQSQTPLNSHSDYCINLLPSFSTMQIPKYNFDHKCFMLLSHFPSPNQPLMAFKCYLMKSKGPFLTKKDLSQEGLWY